MEGGEVPIADIPSQSEILSPQVVSKAQSKLPMSVGPTQAKILADVLQCVAALEAEDKKERAVICNQDAEMVACTR